MEKNTVNHSCTMTGDDGRTERVNDRKSVHKQTNKKERCGGVMREVYLRLQVDERQEGEWEESALQEWERLNTEEGKGECNQERRRAGMETRERRWDLALPQTRAGAGGVSACR